jgi:NarL family two-component system response regulator LiaR
MLEQEDGIEVVGACEDGTEVAAAVRRLAVDVVLLDLLMPRADGFVALRELKAAGSLARVVILTSHRGDDRVRAALAAGADGYLLKSAGVEEVVRAVRAAAAGQAVLDATVAGRLLGRAASTVVDRLSPRELEVLKAIGRGLSNKEIAGRLAISEETVKSHVSNLLAKLQLLDRTQAAIFALREHLVPFDE